MAEAAGCEDRYQRRAAGAVAVLVAVLLIGLAGRLVYIQWRLSPPLTAIMEAQHRTGATLPARRGTVFDTGGRVVAGSRLLYSVYADPTQVQDMPGTAVRLAGILGLEAGDIEDRIRLSGAPRFCWLARRIASVEADAIREAKLPGVGLMDEHVRHYPHGRRMAHVLGFVGAEGRGLEGLELLQDRHLRGCDGYAQRICDARRRPIRPYEGEPIPITPPQDGGHVVLTLDAVIQEAVEQRLAQQVRDFEAQAGYAVVMEPHTGDVLAMACYPAFDPNEFNLYPRESWRNRAVTDVFEPGSTFKPFVATGALTAGYVKKGERIDCHNGLYVVGRRRLHDASPHGLMTFEQIVSKSSNIGMAIIAERMGNEAIHEIVRLFGFGERTGIDLPGESPGGVLPLSRWNSYSTTSVPMGHEIAVTPIQLATAFCAILNDGVLLRPRTVRALLDPEGEVVEQFAGPDPIRRVLSAEVARYFREQVLVQTVTEGTGRRAALPGYQVLGKTGTAQVPFKDQRGYEPGAYLGSFMGAAPAEDPKLAVVVMIERPNPRRGYYGGTAAAPVVRDILAETLAYLQVPPTAEAVATAK